LLIPNITIENYKSFREATAVKFEQGINVVTGQNNSGKTALLEAIHLDFEAKPHRSSLTVPVFGREPSSPSKVNVSIELPHDELIQLLGVGEQWWIPAPALGGDLAQRLDYHGSNEEQHRTLVRFFLGQKAFTFNLTREARRDGKRWLCSRLPSFGVYARRPEGSPAALFVGFTLNDDGTFRGIGAHGQPTNEMEIGVNVAPRLQQRIYRFSAERFQVGRYKYGPPKSLNHDASNLPEVLSALQADKVRFAAYMKSVRFVLPQIWDVSVENIEDGFEVRVLTVDPSTRRNDLAVPLAECGTGIGQVLALLYVVVTSDFPQVVLIDEPQSFLHPGAARKLIEVLKEHRQHQYIISTHSPAIISAAQPERILLTKLRGIETVVEQIKAIERKNLVFCLSDLGARLSDVFGSDNILWVEGRTEEICFTTILRKIPHRQLLGTSIVGVRKTGDFEARDAERVFDIYMDLSKSTALVPPAVGFLFDRECRPEKTRRDLEKKGHGLVKFLPRRMYENYLLVPEAIAACANSNGGFQTGITPNEIRRLIEKKQADPKYYCKGTVPASENWLVEIDGFALLGDIFSELSGTRVSFDKVRDSLTLTEWIAENAPEHLKEVLDMLSAFLAPPAAVSA